MGSFRRVSEGLARRTTRRGLLGRGSEVIFGALAGAAAGTMTRPGPAGAGTGTLCGFPGPPCPCDECNSTGVCGKPCNILTVFYASGCWAVGSITCCDCACPDVPGDGWCGCGSDYHNSPANCP